jgi:hypothetical protein
MLAPHSTPPPPPAQGASGQRALSGKVRSYVPPDHSHGEQFPGRQAPTTQLSLFDAGVFAKLNT